MRPLVRGMDLVAASNTFSVKLSTAQSFAERMVSEVMRIYSDQLEHGRRAIFVESIVCVTIVAECQIDGRSSITCSRIDARRGFGVQDNSVSPRMFQQ